MIKIETPFQRLAIVRQAIDEMVDLALEQGYWPPRDLLLMLVLVKSTMQKEDLNEQIVDDLEVELERVLAEIAYKPIEKMDPEDAPVYSNQKPAVEFEMAEAWAEPQASFGPDEDKFMPHAVPAYKPDTSEQPLIGEPSRVSPIASKLDVEHGPFGKRRVLRIERTEPLQPAMAPCAPVVLTSAPATQTQQIMRRVIRLA